MQGRIVMLIRDGSTSRYLFHALSRDFDIERVIVEDPISRKKLIQGRLKRLGIVRVLGQILFQALVVPRLKKRSQHRISAIRNTYHLQDTPIDEEKLELVSSVNSPECLQSLIEIDPDIVIINGTRIIKPYILQTTDAVFLNIHAGITPQYRGVHGAYWALAQGDSKNCGVTVHVVDSGIDTGEVLYQRQIQPGLDDNFYTYPFIQIGEGIDLMKSAIRDVLNGQLNPVDRSLVSSRLWYHPTIWEYFRTKWKKGIQ